MRCQKTAGLFDEDLRKIDHPVTPRGEPDTRQPEIAFDIPAMSRAVQPAIDHFPGRHRSRSDIFGRYMQDTQTSPDLQDAIMKTVVAKGRLAG